MRACQCTRFCFIPSDIAAIFNCETAFSSTSFVPCVATGFSITRKEVEEETLASLSETSRDCAFAARSTSASEIWTARSRGM